MRITIGKQDYVVGFAYQRSLDWWKRSKRINLKKMRNPPDAPDAPNVTVCTIFGGKNGVDSKRMKRVAMGKAFRSAIDHFNKEVGRKLSLTRALGKFNKKARAAFWKTFLNRRTPGAGRAGGAVRVE